MKRLNIVNRLSDNNSRVDRIWERLTEIALFSRYKKHRAPAEILRAFINPGKEVNQPLSKDELAKLRQVYEFFAEAYREQPTLLDSKLATDQPQFYTLVTSLLSTDIADRFDRDELARRIAVVSQMIDGKVATPRSLEESIQEYKELALRQTTHPARRDRRQTILIQAINAVPQQKAAPPANKSGMMPADDL